LHSFDNNYQTDILVAHKVS